MVSKEQGQGASKGLGRYSLKSVLLSSYSPKWLSSLLHCTFPVFFCLFVLAQRAIQSKTKPSQSIDYIRNTTALIFSPQGTEEIFQEWGDLEEVTAGERCWQSAQRTHTSHSAREVIVA